MHVEQRFVVPFKSKSHKFERVPITSGPISQSTGTAPVLPTFNGSQPFRAQANSLQRKFW